MQPTGRTLNGVMEETDYSQATGSRTTGNSSTSLTPSLCLTPLTYSCDAHNIHLPPSEVGLGTGSVSYHEDSELLREGLGVMQNE
jgi:hypothetical protein